MKTLSDFYADAWTRAGVTNTIHHARKSTSLSLPEMVETEWDKTFETLMRNRMIMGALRYAPLASPCSLDRVEEAMKRLVKFKETGNGEFLVDAANMCLAAFNRKQHKNFHMSSKDDGIHMT